MNTETLTTSLYLYRVHRNRVAMLTKTEKRKAFWLCCGITACVTVSSILWLVYL